MSKIHGTRNTSRKALLLGMVYSTETRPMRGQEFRDRVRCDALDSSYKVYTMDDKHDESLATPGRHCRANFADTHRMLKSMEAKWGPEHSFDMIVLDYFFSPAGWANVRWSESFFKSTLPAFVATNRLSQDGVLWLPHIRHVDEMLEKFGNVLSECYEWKLVNSADMCPLYAATDKVTEQLLRTPDFMTNESQLKPLLDMPFYELKRKAPAKRSCPQMSPMAKKKSSKTVASSRKRTLTKGLSLKSITPVAKERMLPKRKVVGKA